VAGEGEVGDADAVRGVAVGVRLATFPVVLSSDTRPPFACGHELAVTLESERPGDVVGRYTRSAEAVFVALARPGVPRSTRAAIPSEVREHPASCAERRIQFALCVIAAEREVGAARRIRPPGRDELPVGLPH